MKLEMCLQEGNKKKQETDISTHRFCAQIIRDNVFLISWQAFIGQRPV